MMNEYIWLLKLLLAHLLTDFVLQPRSWIEHRAQKHFASTRLYFHGLLTGAVAFLFVGVNYWPLIVAITVTHIIIDGWKSYQRQTTTYFVADQLMHLSVILLGWYFYFISNDQVFSALATLGGSTKFWVYATSVLFLSTPAGIFIGQLTREWREKIFNAESLANAGKWIGIIERLIVFLFVILGQYAAISLLVAAKGIIRFNEKDRPEVKTEYLVIGTLMSIGMALVLGLIVKKLV